MLRVSFHVCAKASPMASRASRSKAGSSAAQSVTKKSVAAAATTSANDAVLPSATQAGTPPPPPPKELAKAAKARKAAGKLRFDAYKAGLQKVDKAHVERVIQEASKGSAFYQKEQRRDEMRREKIEALMKKADEFKYLSSGAKQDIKDRVDEMERELEANRDVRRRYIHVDMDMFYAAVEEKKNPQLRDVPFGVGTQTMLSTTNYIARQYGVRSGMPGFIGKRLCPDLLIVPVDFAAYRREAAIVQSIAARYDAQYQSVGLDELTMDVTEYLKEFPGLTAAQVANDFRDEVYAKTQLTCSGGIAPTAALSKIASNVNKPNGQHEITLLNREDFLQYVRNIPLRKIPGIGYAQEMSLNALNIKTCGDLLKHKYLLAYLFKEKTFDHYLAVGLGLMGATNSQKHHEARQSIGKEVSFSEPLASPEALAKLFRKLVENCHVQCVRENLLARQMRLVLKYHSYDNEQFSIALPHPTNDLKIWLEAGKKLLDTHLDSYAEYRLVGVRMQLVDNAHLSSTQQQQQQAADTTADFEKSRQQSYSARKAEADVAMGDVEEEEEEHHRAQDAEREEEDDYSSASAKNKSYNARTFPTKSAKKNIKAASAAKATKRRR